MIIAVASQKGGVGKTTTSVHLASGLPLFHNKKVLLIDMDSQANSSQTLLPEHRNLTQEQTIWAIFNEDDENDEDVELPIYKSNVDGLDIVPAHLNMSDTDVKLGASQHISPNTILRDKLARVQDNYDHIIIDCPPALSYLTVNAFVCADEVLVPISPGFYEVYSLAKINNTMKRVRKVNPKLSFKGILLTQSDDTNATRETVDAITAVIPDGLLKTRIPRNTAMRDAGFRRMTVYEFKPTAPSAGAYQKLIREIFGYGKK